MSISAKERYYLKRKALYYFYEKGYSNSDIAKMLGISRVTLSKLMAEAKEEGMVKIEIIDTKNLGEVLELEDAVKSRFNLSFVKIIDIRSDNPDTLMSTLAFEGARHLELLLRSGMKVGLAWGKTMTRLVNLLTPNPTIKDLEVYTLLGGACSEAEFQPTLLAQTFLNCYSGNAYTINAPFICHSELLCAEIKKEPSIAKIMESTKNLDLALIGIGRMPTKQYLKGSYYHLPDCVIDEIIDAGAVGDICGIFYDIDGKICETSISKRIVSINIEDLKGSSTVIAVAGGEDKPLSLRGALNGGFIDVLVTDLKTAEELMKI